MGHGHDSKVILNDQKAKKRNLEIFPEDWRLEQQVPEQTSLLF